MDATPYLKTLLFGLLATVAALLPAQTQNRPDPEPPDWAARLEQRLIEVDRVLTGDLGVYIERLDTGESVSLRADQYWYLASGIKIPVAIAVLRAIETGELTLNTEITLTEIDYVDGAGRTNWHGPGSRLSVRYLLEQMVTASDNTATDLLIRRIGIDPVNAITRELVSERGFGPITTLADVRRHAYSGFHPDAFRLSGHDFFTLRKADGETRRLETLAELIGVDLAEFAQQDLDSVFERYYATDLNSGQLDAYAGLLKALIRGEALSPDGTHHLLALMRNVTTGTRRITAGLPDSVAFAHKTGTQHRRACDFGVVYSDGESGRPLAIVTACTRDFIALSSAETALRAVGEAILDSGVLDGSEATLARRFRP